MASRTRHSVLLLIAVMLGVLSAIGSSQANGRDDDAALATIFGESDLIDVLELRKRCVDRSPLQQFTTLRRAVFPTGRDAIQVAYTFAPAHVDPTTANQYALIDPLSRFRDHDSKRALARGGQLIAPLRDLLRVANELGRIEEIESLARERATIPGNATAALTVNILIAMERRDFESANAQLLKFQQLVASRSVDEGQLGPETLVIAAALEHPETWDRASELAFRLYEVVRVGNAIGSESWRRHLFAMTYLSQYLLKEQNRNAQGELLQRWHPVTRMDSESNGCGFPLPLWERQRGEIKSVTGHDRDYLYFDTPLVGDFVVEADVSPFGYGDTRLGYGGVWAGPGYDLKSILNGRFGKDDPTLTVDPPLDEIIDSMRVRLVVREGVRTTSINGRRVFESPVSASDPWLSIFSYWYTHGWVKNLRIMGDPAIPDEISLVAGPDLPGWNHYHRDQSWKWTNESPSEPTTADGMLIGERQRWLVAGAMHESLLQYHRPVLEDGTISYRFFYQSGEFNVHPALDRWAFLIDADGVREHRIGDGRFERTALHPANRELVQTHQRGGRALPLLEEDWNELALTVIGDDLSIRLNGEVVFEKRLVARSRRVFGLFHFSDLTESRVKEIRWCGEWPKSIPEPSIQELADRQVEEMVDGPTLPYEFEYSFASGLPLTTFLVWGENWKDRATVTPSGVSWVQPGRDGYVQSMISPQLKIEGDFDVVAEFSDFAVEIAEGGDGNIHLYVGLEEQLHECRVYRKFSRFEKKERGEQLIHAAHFHGRDPKRRYDFPAESSESTTWGKLRFVRRGDQLHYLYASEDSSSFQWLHTETVPTSAIRAGELRLGVETTKAGMAACTWKSLSIRAEKLTGPAMTDALSIAELNKARARLNEQYDRDFSDAAPLRGLRTWGRDAVFEIDHDGLKVRAPGFKTWHGHGIAPQLQFEGDFDASLQIDVRKLEKPAEGGESVVYLQAEFMDPDRTAIETKFAISDRGEKAAEIQLRRRDAEGEFSYREPARVPMDRVDQLRMVRKDGVAYFIVDSNDSEPMILGQLKVGDYPLPLGGIRAMVHTAGEGRETVVVLKRLEVWAESIRERR